MKVAFDFIYGMLIVLKETITLKKKTCGWREVITFMKMRFPSTLCL